MEPQANKKSRQFWLGIIVSLISLIVIFLFIRPDEILYAISTANFGYLLLGALGIVVFLMIRAVRWRFLLNNDAPWFTVFHIQNIGYMLSSLLPFRIGDVARAVLIGNVPPITISRGISTMVVERILDMLFIVTLLPFTLSQVNNLPDWMRSGAIASGFLGIVAILLMIFAANKQSLSLSILEGLLKKIPFLNTDAWVGRAANFLSGLDSLTNLKDALLLILLSIVTWVPIIFAYYMMLLAVNLQPSLAMATFVVIAAAFSVAIPSSPGQIGVFHAGVIAALQVWGQPEVASASFAFLYHGINTLTLVFMGISGLFATGSTFRHVLDSTQSFINRKKPEESVGE